MNIKAFELLFISSAFTRTCAHVFTSSFNYKNLITLFFSVRWDTTLKEIYRKTEKREEVEAENKRVERSYQFKQDRKSSELWKIYKTSHKMSEKSDDVHENGLEIHSCKAGSGIFMELTRQAVAKKVDN